MFVRIGDVLPRLWGYEQLFPSYEILRQTLSKAYFTIIEFCIDAKSIFAQAKRSSGEDLMIDFTVPRVALG
jgi:hypothetical protein